jgi:predicted AAA+ superfamily ATPase
MGVNRLRALFKKNGVKWSLIIVNVEIFITGSSAALLSREIVTSLRGRAREVVIHPFSMEEGRAFPQAQKRLLTLTRDGLPREVLAGVLAQPAYVWLLAPPDAE